MDKQTSEILFFYAISNLEWLSHDSSQNMCWKLNEKFPLIMSYSWIILKDFNVIAQIFKLKNNLFDEEFLPGESKTARSFFVFVFVFGSFVLKSM